MKFASSLEPEEICMISINSHFAPSRSKLVLDAYCAD
jgi:hypothetical protein